MPYHSSIGKDGILNTLADETRELILGQLHKNQLKDIKSNSSTVALAVNAFGYFCNKVEELPNYQMIWILNGNQNIWNFSLYSYS